MSSDPVISTICINRQTSLSRFAVSTVTSICHGIRITQVPAGIDALSGRQLTKTPRSSLLPAVARIVKDGNSAPCSWSTSNKSSTPSFPHWSLVVVAEEEGSVTMPLLLAKCDCRRPSCCRVRFACSAQQQPTATFACVHQQDLPTSKNKCKSPRVNIFVCSYDFLSYSLYIHLLEDITTGFNYIEQLTKKKRCWQKIYYIHSWNVQ